MKKTVFAIVLIIASMSLVFSQEKVICKTGKITFEASVPAFEEVKAVNNNVTFVLDTKTGDIASLALVKGFRFKVALMEEHFNENYVESDTFPKAIFKGKIEAFDAKNLTETPKEYVLNGKLELHGKTVSIKTTIKISKSKDGINLNSSFIVNASDYDISIPSAVKSKVSNKISVQLVASLK